MVNSKEDKPTLNMDEFMRAIDPNRTLVNQNRHHVMVGILAPVIDKMIEGDVFVLVCATVGEPAEVGYVSNMDPESQYNLMSELLEQIRTKKEEEEQQDKENEDPSTS